MSKCANIEKIKSELENLGLGISIDDLKAIKESSKMLISAKEFLDNLIDIKWEPDMKVLDSLFGKNGMKEEVLREYMGYATEKDMEKMSYDEVEIAIAINRDIDKSIEAVEKLYEDMNGKDADTKRGMYFDWFYSSNGRYMLDSNTINPQTDKLHRFIVHPDSHNITYTVTGKGKDIKLVNDAGKDVTDLVKYALAQAFGFAVDKKSTAAVMEVGSTLLDIASNKKRLAELVKAVKEGDHKTIKDLGLEVDHVSHTMQALDMMSQIGKLGSKKGTITSSLTAEFDAVTSGFGLKLLQFPILKHTPKDKLKTTWTWLNKVGVFRKGDVKGVMSMNDHLARDDIFDSYQTLARDVKPDPAGLSSTQKGIWEAATTILPKLDKVNGVDVVSKSLRDLFKDPFMTFNYSAGITSIRRSLSNVLTSKLVNSIMKGDAGTEKVVKYLVENIDEVDNAAELKELLHSTPLRKVMIGNKNLEKQLQDMFNATYGASVEEIMQDNFKDFMKANDTINGTFRLMFAMFKKEYDAAKSAVPVGSWTNEKFLEIMYGADGNSGLQKKFPMIKGPLSNTLREGIGVYSSSAQTPTSASERYKPAQTPLVGSKEKSSKVRHEIRDFEAAVSSGSVIPIHYIDAAVLAQLGGKDFTSIHDAIMPPLDIAIERIKGYNKAIYDVSSRYSVVEEIWNRLNEALDMDSKGTKLTSARDKMDYLSNEFSKVEVMRYGADGKRVSTKGKEIRLLYSDLETLAKVTRDARSELFGTKSEIAYIGHMAGVPGSMWERDTGKLGAGDIYSQKEMGVSVEEMVSIDKANKVFLSNNPQITVVYGDTFSYDNNVITVDTTADAADLVVYTAHEIVHAKTSEWMSKEENKHLVDKLKKATDEVLEKIGQIPLNDMTEEVAILKDRLEWANGKSDDNYTRTVENVAVLAAEPAMRKELLKLLPEAKRSLIGRILDKVKEWLGKELPMDGKRILELVDSMVVKAEQKQEVATISNKKEVADDVITKLTALMADKKIESVQAIINKIKEC